MAAFDSVHTGQRCGQTKALGALMRTLTVGDEVGGRDRCIAMHEGGYLVIRGGILIGWQDEPEDRLALVDNAGRTLDADDLDSEGRPLADYLYPDDPGADRLLEAMYPGGRLQPGWRRGEPGSCLTCAALRARGASGADVSPSMPEPTPSKEQEQSTRPKRR
jgi:hypothetical protein